MGFTRKKRVRFLEKSPENGPETRKDEKKVGFTGQKTSAIPRKSPENGLKTGKSGKNGDFGAKKEGWCGGEKMGFTTDFAILQSSKMGANEFFSHFFSVISCRECGNALPLHSQSGSNALAREGYALKATRQRKRCCDL